MAGGGLFNHLDYSFTVGHEDGTFGPLPATQPGGGTPALRSQFRILHEFLMGLDFIHMAPARDVLKSVTPEGAGVRVLAEPGRSYGIYVYHVKRKGEGEDRGKFVVATGAQRAALTLDLPAGKYSAAWVDTKTGDERGKEKFTHAGGDRVFNAPEHSEDIALRITAGK
jgi:hypothetical protein